jgi:trk system potassium uptake protein TrkA
MKAVIIGGGAVGQNLADMLTREGHNVTVIDNDDEKLAAINEKLDVGTMRGEGTDLSVMRMVGVGDCDFLAAVTNVDEINILAAMAARKLGAGKTIARARKAIYQPGPMYAYSSLFEIDHIVNPDTLTSNEIGKLLRTPGALAVENFARGKVQMRELAVGARSRAAGKPLRDLPRDRVGLVAAISRAGRIIVPTGDTIIEAEDRVYIIGKTENLHKANKVFGRSSPPRQSVFILGGGSMGFALARMLERDELDVKIIERDRDRAVFLSESLERTLVLAGDGTDANLLKEEGIANADAFVALSGEDEDNILSGLLARELGVAETIVMVERPDYVGIVKRLGIDMAVSPRLLTVNEILRFVRRGNIESVAVLEKEKAEMIEVRVAHHAEVAGKKLMHAGLPRGSVAGSIVRGEEVIIPSGNDTLEPGDTIIIFTRPENISKIEKLFY